MRISLRFRGPQKNRRCRKRDGEQNRETPDCTLVPCWSGRLGKSELHAYQLSGRGGELFCTDRGERVTIGGHAVEYLSGELSVPV